MIAGRYLPRGDGRALALEVVVPELGTEASVRSSAVPGPFVVVSVAVQKDETLSAHADLYILGGGAPVTGAVGGGAVGMVQLTPRGFRLPDEAGVVRGGIALALGRVTEWFPWFVYEGTVGYVLLVARTGWPGAAYRVAAALSIWPLVDALVPEELPGRERMKPAVAGVLRRAYAVPHAARF